MTSTPTFSATDLRCYTRDPDGYLVEVGQATGMLEGIFADLCGTRPMRTTSPPLRGPGLLLRGPGLLLVVMAASARSTTVVRTFSVLVPPRHPTCAHQPLDGAAGHRDPPAAGRPTSSGALPIVDRTNTQAIGEAAL